jgi:hypothetical protein
MKSYSYFSESSSNPTELERVNDIKRLYSICGNWSIPKVVDLDEKGLFKWKNKKEKDFFYSMVDKETAKVIPRSEL